MKFVTIKQMSQIFDNSEQTMRNWLDQGRIPCYRVPAPAGRKPGPRKVLPGDLLAYLLEIGFPNVTCEEDLKDLLGKKSSKPQQVGVRLGKVDDMHNTLQEVLKFTGRVMHSSYPRTDTERIRTLIIDTLARHGLRSA